MTTQTVDTETIDLSNALRTVAVNGAWHASRALSKWLRKGVRLTCEGFESVPLADASKMIGEPDDTIAAILLPLTGDLSGHLLLAFPEKVGLTLVDIMMQQAPGTATQFDELEESGLCETGNIVASAYSNSLAKWLKLKIEPSVPEFALDMVCSILDPLLVETATHHDELLMATTEFLLDGQRMQWSMLLLPSRESLKLMEQRCHLESVRNNALKTIAINGAFNASRAMSKWLKRGVKISTEGFAQVELSDMGLQFDEDKPLVALLMELKDRVHGHTLLAIGLDHACCLVDLLMDQEPGTTTDIGELERSCLEETGNIISGAFINSWSTWLDMRIEPAVPQFVCDLPGAILDSILADSVLTSDQVFMARTDFILDKHAVEWVFMLLPAPSSMRLIESLCE